MLENELDKRACSEILEILNHTDKNIVEKIPDKFKEFLMENKDDEYKPNINFFNENWDDTILEDTKAIMALIYRDYIASTDERKKLLAEEKKFEEEKESELREKYNADNLFKKREIEIPVESVEETHLVEIKEYPWYKRLYQKILSIFNIRNK